MKPEPTPPLGAPISIPGTAFAAPPTAALQVILGYSHIHIPSFSKPWQLLLQNISRGSLVAQWLRIHLPGIKIAGENIKNFGYADDTTFMTESEEELKTLLMKVKEVSEKTGLKFNISKH